MRPLDRALWEFKDLADKMPVLPKTIPTTIPTKCHGCGQEMAPAEPATYQTPAGLQVRDNLCRACAGKVAKNMMALACLRCLRVVLRMQPLKHSSGFVFKPATIYHVTECPDCIEAKSEHEHPVKIAELENYMRQKYGKH